MHNVLSHISENLDGNSTTKNLTMRINHLRDLLRNELAINKIDPEKYDPYIELLQFLLSSSGKCDIDIDGKLSKHTITCFETILNVNFYSIGEIPNKDIRDFLLNLLKSQDIITMREESHLDEDSPIEDDDDEFSQDFPFIDNYDSTKENDESIFSRIFYRTTTTTSITTTTHLLYSVYIAIK